MAETRKAILLRISPELWAELNRWAAAEFRSVNAQIEYLLVQALRQRRGAVPAPADDAAFDAFWQAHPWLRKLTDDLRQLGLTHWAQRLEGAASFGGGGRNALRNLKTTLDELLAATPDLPGELAEIARGLRSVAAAHARGTDGQ